MISCIPSNVIIHLMGKYQLQQQKGVCLRQVAQHPMTVGLGGLGGFKEARTKTELRSHCTYYIATGHKSTFLAWDLFWTY